MINVGVVSLGCSKNLVDTENMLGMLKSEGYGFTSDPAQADVIIVNTCGFIESAKEESINAILEMAGYKNGRCTTLVVTGCLSQRYREDIRQEMPEIDILLGVNEYEKLPGLLNARYDGSRGVCEKLPRLLTTPPYTAYLRIADGCANRCAYCAIPLIRGDYVSRPFEDILTEAEWLLKNGVTELNVIAQDTTHYGVDIYGKKRLPELLRALSATSAHWIRLLYTYSDDIDGELLDAMCSSEKIVKYIDIPVQHADDTVLENMHRRGNRKALEGMMNAIREKDARFVLRTTFLVGFPGETDAQFETLLEFMQAHPFERAGAFAYSREEGTPADLMDAQLDEDVKTRRLDKLMRVQQRLSKAFNASRVGKTYEVLCEGRQGDMYYGRSYAEAPDIDGKIFFSSHTPVNAGEYVQVNITGAAEYDLTGVRI